MCLFQYIYGELPIPLDLWNTKKYVFPARKLHKGTDIRTEGAYLFFCYTFSHKIVTEICNSNNFQSLYTAKSFLNWKVVLNSRHMPVLNAYSDIIHLQTHSNKHQFISQILDSIQATRCKVENKPPTFWLISSFNLISLPKSKIIIDE